jgi:hypothetical protein
LDMVRIGSFGKNECEVVKLGFKGNSIQTFLRVYNPIYKRL